MSRLRLLLAIVLLAASSAAVRAESPATISPADPTLDALLSAIRSNRKAFVAVNLQLTDEEAGKFWPVYDRYQADINKVGDRFLALVQDYTASFPTLSDDKAMKIVEDYLAIEADRVEVRKTYVKEFAASLPGRKVARLYQLENKMDAVIRYDIASTVPVLESK